MNPHEKDLITTVVGRLKKADGQLKDADAEVLIRRAWRDQVDARYYLVQTVLIQDLGLTNKQALIAALERQLLVPRSSSGISFPGGCSGAPNARISERQRIFKPVPRAKSVHHQRHRRSATRRRSPLLRFLTQ